MDTIFYILASIAILNHFLSGNKGPDDTDSSDGKKKSGLRLYTDYGTGAQYVCTSLGGITPRLDKSGNPMVVRFTGGE